jgi:hypothetical protein
MDCSAEETKWVDKQGNRSEWHGIAAAMQKRALELRSHACNGTAEEKRRQDLLWIRIDRLRSEENRMGDEGQGLEKQRRGIAMHEAKRVGKVRT